MKTKILFFTAFLFFPSYLIYTQSISVDNILQNASFLKKNNQYKEAKSILKEGLKKYTQNSDIFYQLGEIYILEGNIKEAIPYLQKSIEFDPKSDTKLKYLADIYFDIHNYDKAVEGYLEASKLVKDKNLKLSYYLEVVNLFHKEDKILLTKKYIQEGLKIDPENFDMNYFYACFLNEMGKYNESLQIMSSLIKNMEEVEGNEKYFFEIGKSQFYLGEYEKARENFNKIEKNKLYKIKTSPFKTDYLIEVAISLFEIFEYEASEKYLNIVLTLDPSNIKGLQLKNKLDPIKTNKDKLISALQTSIEKEKDKKILLDKYSELAVLQYHQGDFGATIITIDKLLELNKKSILFTLLKAICEKKLGMETETHILMTKAVKNPYLNKELKTKISIALGFIFRYKGDYQNATKYFKDGYYGNYKNIANMELKKTYHMFFVNKVE